MKRELIMMLVIFGICLLGAILNYLKIDLLHPGDGEVFNNKEINFVWDRKCKGLIYIDENNKFSSPIIKEINSNSEILNLNFGKYYWKIKCGMFSSDIKSFNVNSVVGLSQDKENVINTGNTILNVKVFEDNIFTGAVVLDINNTLKKKDSNLFVGQEYGN